MTSPVSPPSILPVFCRNPFSLRALHRILHRCHKGNPSSVRALRLAFLRFSHSTLVAALLLPARSTSVVRRLLPSLHHQGNPSSVRALHLPFLRFTALLLPARSTSVVRRLLPRHSTSVTALLRLLLTRHSVTCVRLLQRGHSVSAVRRFLNDQPGPAHSLSTTF